MAKRSITPALHLLKKLKRLALDEGRSIFALLRELIEGTLRGGDSHERARKKALEDMKHPRNLGTYGKATWTRDELHERR